MTIDELFSMPICEMKEWMSEHYTEPRGYYEESYWFCNIDEMFDELTIPEDSNWRIIPVMSTYRNDNYTALDNIKRGLGSLSFGVAKKSKYGELLLYVFDGSLERTTTTKNFISRFFSFELESISCNSNNGVKNSRIYLAGKDVVNNSEIAVHFRLGKTPGDETWIEQYEFLDKYASIDYFVKPVLGGIKKNKHCLNEYAEKLEDYAKKFQDVGLKAYLKNEDILHDNDFVGKANKLGMAPNDVYNIWLSLYLENENTTLEDVFGIIALTQSEDKKFEDYVLSCKGKMMEKDYKNKWKVREYNYYGPYKLSPLFGKSVNVNASGFLPLVKKLDKTREMYLSMAGYKNELKSAVKEYKDGFMEIAKTFENDIADIYSKIKKELEEAKKKYLDAANTLYTNVHDKYPNVNDSDLGVFDNLNEITDCIDHDFKKTSVKLMKLVNPKYSSNNNSFIVKNGNKKQWFSEQFKSHVKLMFDACPELKEIPYFAAGKAYDAPYELRDNDYVLEKLSDETVYEYEEIYGQDSFAMWADTFNSLKPYYDNWKDWDDLYPGQQRVLYITRDFEDIEKTED